jgi:hypothetical protein
VLEGGVGRQDGVVGFDNRGGDLGSGVHTELKLGFLAVVNREALEEKGAETRAGAAAKRVENEKALKTSASIGQLADAFEHRVDEFLADRLVATRVVVRGILLAGNELLRMEELPVGSGADLIDDRGLQVDKDGTRNVLAVAGLREESIKGRVAAVLFGRDVAIGLDAVFEAVQLPASITNLDASLANVNRDDFAHDDSQ